ncbi:MAG TPA: YggS family pyridoxal phosphate-dependent enzyme [Nitrospira sp.]|nr:YggS family pyridoxal phosphate-dependent enzyme [Nitrospira sp.]
MDVQAGDSIKDRLAAVFGRIRRAVQDAGRDENEVRLVAASKSIPVDRIREAIDAGVHIVGENRLQEALPKIEALEGEAIAWHFIGQLQRRKARAVVGVFELIHSVDTVELAVEIDRRAAVAGLRQKILLEINLGAEESKGGFLTDQVEEALLQLAALDHVAIEGLMAVPPLVNDAEASRPYFRRLRELAARLTGQGRSGHSFKELSMGMSSDYVVAIQEGATLVRLGTAIFGGRRG